MPTPILGFDWDAGNRAKCRTHGVSVNELETLLTGSPRVAPDPKHSTSEVRFVAVGRNGEGRPLFVVFTVRLSVDARLMRPISARYMHAKEIASYEADGS